MTWRASEIPDHRGRIFLVTGGNGGLGLECVRALAKARARVVIACRRPAAAEDAKATVLAETPGAELETLELDLASLASVKRAAEEFKSRHDHLDVLLNNAGVMALPHRTTIDGFEMQLATNHFGHFALTGRLADVIRGRVVTVTSAMHWLGRIDFDDLHGERGYDKWKAYNQSKLANLLFSSELARRGEGKGIVAVAAHPGYAATNLQTTGPQMAASRVSVEFYRGLRVVAQSARAGALPLLYAATMPDVRTDDFWGPALVGWGSPKRNPRSKAARDRDVAARLWRVTSEQTGVAFFD